MVCKGTSDAMLVEIVCACTMQARDPERVSKMGKKLKEIGVETGGAKRDQPSS